MNNEKDAKEKILIFTKNTGDKNRLKQSTIASMINANKENNKKGN